MLGEVSIIPMMAAYPHSHMGHRYDLGEKIKSLPGKKIVGISCKTDVLGSHLRRQIIERQWEDIDCEFVITNTVGVIVEMARRYGDNLHILVGHDRKKKLGDHLKVCLEAGTIKEMHGQKFKNITIHTPDNVDRPHGLSGTAMRQAIADDNFNTYEKHYGEYDLECELLWVSLRNAFIKGELQVKRKT